MSLKHPTPAPLTPSLSLAPAATNKPKRPRPDSFISPNPSSSSISTVPIASSPKRAKLSPLPSSGVPAEGPKPALTKGAQWVVRLVDRIALEYTEAVRAATAVVRYRQYATSQGLKGAKVPPHLSQRVQSAYDRYEASRRLLERYQELNAQHVASPSAPIPAMSATNIPAPSPAPPSAVPAHLVPPASNPTDGTSSPIPLASANYLAFNHDQQTSSITSAASTVPPPLPPTSASEQGQGPGLVPLPPIPGEGDRTSAIDFSSLGIGELSAIITGDGYNFAELAGVDMPKGPTQPQGGPSPMTMLLSGDTEQGLAGLGITTNSLSSAAGSAIDQMDQGQGMTPNTQAETDKLLASLGELTNPTSNPIAVPDTTSSQSIPPLAPQPLQQAPTTDISGAGDKAAQDNVDSLLASLQPQTQNQNQNPPQALGVSQSQAPSEGQPPEMDFSTDMDLSGLNELMGFFDGGAGGGGGGGSNGTNTNPVTGTTTPNLGSAQIQQQKQMPPPMDDLSALMQGAQQGSAGGGGGEGGDLGLLGDFDGAAGAIDLADFNFGDGSLPNVDGDEFESLFAEFK